MRRYIQSVSVNNQRPCNTFPLLKLMIWEKVCINASHSRAKTVITIYSICSPITVTVSAVLRLLSSIKVCSQAPKHHYSAIIEITGMLSVISNGYYPCAIHDSLWTLLVSLCVSQFNQNGLKQIISIDWKKLRFDQRQCFVNPNNEGRNNYLDSHNKLMISYVLLKSAAQD